jgi:hypothetical protein
MLTVGPSESPLVLQLKSLADKSMRAARMACPAARRRNTITSRGILYADAASAAFVTPA